MKSTAQRLVNGAIAGMAATAPMSVLMMWGHCRLPRRQRSPLPPAKITHTLLRKVGIEQAVPDRAEVGLTLVNHFAYGAACGALFELSRVDQSPPTLKQSLCYGMGIWLGSYLGLLPAMDLHRSAAREPFGRNLLMIGAHAVWGGSLCLAVNLIEGKGIIDQEPVLGDGEVTEESRASA
jgi:putative membrane protein